MTRYRILCNGTKYRVQHRWMCLWCTAMRQGTYDDHPYEFDELQAALQYIDDIQPARSQPWVVHSEITVRPSGWQSH